MTDPMVEELKAQLADHDDLMIVVDTPEDTIELQITEVSFTDGRIVVTVSE